MAPEMAPTTDAPAPASPPAAAPATTLAAFRVDERPGAPKPAHQLTLLLQTMPDQVGDLFADWDEDSNGMVSREEARTVPAPNLEGRSRRMECESETAASDGSERAALPTHATKTTAHTRYSHSDSD